MTSLMQSTNCTVLGEAMIGEVHPPAPVPDVKTVIEMDVEPSETRTVPPEVAEDGTALRIETMLPLTEATIDPLSEDALYVPDPPDRLT